MFTFVVVVIQQQIKVITTMKVESLTFRHIGLIEDGQYDVHSRNVIVMGKNQLGKSTFTQCLANLAEGKLKEFARNGEDVAQAEFTFDDGTVIKWSSAFGNESVELYYPDGTKEKKKVTQVLLKKLLGEQFDITKFINGAPAYRKKKIAEFSGVPIEDYSNKVKAAIEARRDANRDLKNQQAKIGDFVPGVFSYEEYDINSLHTRKKELQAKQVAVTDLEKNLNITRNELKMQEAQANNLREQIEALQLKLVNLDDQIANNYRKLDDNTRLLESYDDFSDEINLLEGKIEKAYETQSEVAEYNAKVAEFERLKELTKLAEEAEEGVETARFELTDAMAMGNFPKGVTITEDADDLIVQDNKGNQIPLHMLNDAQKIITGLHIGVNYLGKCKTLAADLSLLDSENRKKVFAWAKKNNLQLFAEVVADNPSLTIQYKE